MKTQIMQAVLSAQSNLTVDQVKYLDRYLPTQESECVLTFDHAQGNTYDACGLSDEVSDPLTDEFNSLMRKASGDDNIHTKSQIIEYVINNCSTKLMHFLTVHAILEQMNKKEKQMRDLMQMFRDSQDQ